MPAVRNPSTVEVEKMLAAATGGGLRVARDHASGDLYVWDAAEATHRQMIEQLRLLMADGAGFVFSAGDYERLRQR